MADLSELQSAPVTKIAGANATTGNEDYFVDADGNGNLKVIDFATAATGSAVPSNASFLAAKNPGGLLTGLNIDSLGNLQIGTLNTTVGGTLSASDSVVPAPMGDGTIVSGTSTTGSVVYAPVPDGYQAWTILVKGYTSGTVYTEASNNTTNGIDGDWVEVKAMRTGTVPGIDSVVYAITANGYYRGNAAGFKALRARLIGAPTVTIQFVLSNGQGATFLNSGIPGGTNTIGQVYVTSASAFSAAVSGFNRLNVSPEPSDLLSDKFDSALDTAVRWTSTIIGTATDPAAGGSLNLAGGTTSGNAVIVASQPLFTQKANVQLGHGVTLKFEAGPIITGAHRFWGFGTTNLNTVAAPLTDAIGWELDSSGSVNAVIYQGGTKVFSSPVTTPTDGKNHRYNFQWRTDKVVFYYDSGDIPSAIASGYIPNVQVMPARFHVIVGTVSTSPTLTVTAVGISDTGRNSTAISDGVYGFRKASVTANNDLHVQDSINTSMVNGAISVTTTASEAKVGSSRLVARKAILITPTNGVVYFGSSAAVTTSTGTPIFKNQSYSLAATDNVPVYLIAASTVDVRIVEGS